MKPHEWVVRWIKENPGTNQTELARLAGIPNGKMSDIINEKQGPTATYMVPISRVMNVSLDSIYDPDAKWPGKPIQGEGVRLTRAQERLLEEAAFLCGQDETLTLAIMRLRGHPDAFIGGAGVKPILVEGQPLKADPSRGKPSARNGNKKSG